MIEPLELQEYETRSFPLNRAQAEGIRTAADGRIRVGLGSTPDSYELTAGSHVGVVVTPDVSVLIRPKVPIRNLFLLLGVAPPDFAHTSFRFDIDRDLLVMMAAVFAQSVDQATMRGVHRGYRPTEERLRSPRGRIDLVEQLKHPAVVSPIACRFDEYTSDVFANRSLVAAMDRVERIPGLPPQLRNSLNRLRQRFDEVTHVAVSPEEIDRWIPTRLDRHYEQPLRLAAVILRNLSLTHSAGGSPSATFLIDMNLLFQQFVADRLRRHLRPLDLVEEPPVALALHRRLVMRPDLVVRRRRSDVYVGDVKYKLSSGPARMSDYYQLLAYTTAMSLDEGVLVYAQDPGDADDPIGDERVHSARIRNTGTDIHVYRLPLGGSNDDLEAAMAELSDWIARRCAALSLEAA